MVSVTLSSYQSRGGRRGRITKVNQSKKRKHKTRETREEQLSNPRLKGQGARRVHSEDARQQPQIACQGSKLGGAWGKDKRTH